MSTISVSERYHPLFEQYIDDWAFYMESYKGGTEYVRKYLYTHRLESREDYGRRINRAYYLNYCAPIASIPSDFIFKKEATRPADANLELFRMNTNRRGLSIHEFMRKVCTLSAIYGHAHILIDRPRPTKEDEEKISKRTLTKSEVVGAYPPYAVIVHPYNLLDWSVDPVTRELNWVIIRELILDDADFTEERGITDTYRVWTQTSWILYSDENKELDRGDHNLGVVPLITCYHKDIDEDLVGESMLKDVAEANRTIFNWTSNIDEMVARQTFSQLTCPDDGTLFEEEVDESGQSTALKKVGSSTIFTFPAEARHPPKFISPDTEQVGIIWTMIENHVREMFRMAGLISAKSSLIQLQQRTGKAQEFEFLDMAVFLAAKANVLEDTENKMNELCYKWLQLDDHPARVHYPEKFDIVSPGEIVDLFTKVTMNGISGTLNKEMAKRMVHQVLPNAEDEIVDKIYTEIEDNEYLNDPTKFMMEAQEQPPKQQNSPYKADSSAQDERESRKKESVKKPKGKTEPVPNASNPERRAKFRSRHEE